MLSPGGFIFGRHSTLLTSGIGCTAVLGRAMVGTQALRLYCGMCSQGISMGEDVKKSATLMGLTTQGFLVAQIGFYLVSDKGFKYIALAGACVCVVMLVVYCAIQVSPLAWYWQTWLLVLTGLSFGSVRRWSLNM